MAKQAPLSTLLTGTLTVVCVRVCVSLSHDLLVPLGTLMNRHALLVEVKVIVGEYQLLLQLR